MNVQNTTTANQVNWSELLSKLDAATNAAATSGVTGVSVENKSVTITSAADGVARTVTLPIPDDLEVPGTVDEAAIETLCAKLSGDKSLGLTDADVKAVHEALMQALDIARGPLTQTIANGGSKNVFFDLYKLMALLVEVGQKQRDAAREMRSQQNQAIQKSILNQAEQQKEAALTGMIAGAICCAAQVAMSAFSLYKQGAAFKQQLGSFTSSGVDSAKANLEMIKAADTPQNANKQLAEVTAEVGNKPSGTANRTIARDVGEFGFPEGEKAIAKHQALKLKVQADGQEMQLINERHSNGTLRSADLPEGIVKTAQAKLEAFEQKIAENGLNVQDVDQFITLSRAAEMGQLDVPNRVKLMDIGNRFPALKTFGNQTSAELKAGVATAVQNRTAELQQTIATDTDQLSVLRQGVHDSVMGDLNRYENEYDAALRDVNSITSSTPADKAATYRAKLELAGDKLKFARAKAYDTLAKSDFTNSAEYARDVKLAGDFVDKAEQGRVSDIGYIKATHALNQGRAYNDIIAAVGNAAQSFVSNIVQYKQAEATRMGAEQEKERENLDQTKELFNQAQSLVDAVVQLMQAVYSAETQSMRDAIQA